MRVRHMLLGSIAIALMALPLAAQTATPAPVLSSIQSPYPAVQSQVTMPPGGTFPRGTVSYGPAGTPLVLSGKGFGGGGSVLFPVYNASGTIPGMVTSWSESIIFVKVPPGAGAGAVTVVTDQGKTSNPFPFIVTNGNYSASCAQFPPTSQFQITTSSLPNGTASQGYSVTLAASGGISPYTWSLTGSQGLPAGLSLNASTGVISGTPTSGAGPLNLNVEATDSSSPTLASDATLGLTIDSPTLTQAGVYSYSASYDHAGNVISYADSVMGQWTFTPDTLNRLTSAVPATGVYSGQSQQLCFNYDPFGNRTQANLQTTACSSSNPATAKYNTANEVTWTTVNSAVNGFTYDGAGNVTYDGNNYYAYDGESRLCAVETTLYSGGTVAYGYIYDAEGRRVAKGSITVTSTPLAQSACNPTTNGFQLTESYVLGQDGEQLTTLNGSGAWQRTNVYGAGKLIATYDTSTSGLPDDAGTPGGLHFQLADPQGTRRVQTNSAGEAELDCQSLPFGDQLSCFPDPNAPDNDQDEDATGSLTGIHFTGKERDAESGLDYFGARYYASNMGRFMSPDWDSSPVAIPYADRTNPQSFNLYSYVGNNPLSRTDPDGHCTNGGQQKGFFWCLFNDSDQDAAQARQNLAQYKNISINGKTPADAAKGLNNTQTVRLDRSVFNYISSQVMSSPGMVLALAIVPGGAEELVSAEAAAAADSGSLLNLNKSLASQEQMGQLAAGQGEAIAGAGTGTTLRDSQRLASQYGGDPADWQKVASKNYNPGGAKGGGFETHAYQNVKTGQVVEMKTKFQ